MGGIIGFLSSLTKNKFVFIGGIIGLIVGLYFEFLLITQKGIKILWFLKLINVFYYPLHDDIVFRFFILPILLVIVFSLIGILLGFVGGIIVRKFGKK